jgi:anthranilate phosphoribosyltransferase
MREFIAKIGRGLKTSKDLTWEEAKRAMRMLIEGQATSAQVGAFLVAMRIKTESVAELAAFTAAVREYVPPLAVRRGLPLVDLPTYAGKRETFHASVGAAIVAAAAGTAVLVHGDDAAPERPGTMAVLKQLGVPTEYDAKHVVDALETRGFAYLNIAVYHPPVARFLELRQELGLRNLFHPVVRLLNPARAQSQVIGISHPPYFEKTIEALKMLGCPRALVLRGEEGEPELSLATVTKVLELRDERVSPLTFHARDAGILPRPLREVAGFSHAHLDKEALLLRRILSNEVHGAQRDWVVLNAAMLLYAAGKAPSIRAAVPQAAEAIGSGAAARKLKEVTSSRSLDVSPGNPEGDGVTRRSGGLPGPEVPQSEVFAQ